MPTPLERYLRDLHAIHTSGAGTPELAYYSPLETLLSSIGEELSPEVLEAYIRSHSPVPEPPAGRWMRVPT